MFKPLLSVNPCLSQLTLFLYPKNTKENVIHFFQESIAKSKESFLKSCLKPDSEFIGLSYPIDLVLFNEETQSCITLASQFFGLDTNGYVTESLLSLLFVLSTCQIESKILG